MASHRETELGIAVITLARTAELGAVAYVKKPSDPQMYLNYQEAHWNLHGRVMGLPHSDLVIPDVPWKEDQMRQFMGEGSIGLLTGMQDIPFYLPQVVSGKEGLSFFSKAYPWMRWNDKDMANAEIQNVDGEGNPIQLFGHLRTEAAIDAPHTRTNEGQAADILARSGRRGHTLNTYVVAGDQSKLLRGKYLDQDRTMVRLMLSRAHGRVVSALFFPSGYCDVDLSLRPGNVGPRLGVRSVGV